MSAPSDNGSQVIRQKCTYALTLDYKVTTKYVDIHASLTQALDSSRKANDYSVETIHRNGSKGGVSVYNHHSTTYETTAPHPGYNQPPSPYAEEIMERYRKQEQHAEQHHERN